MIENQQQTTWNATKAWQDFGRRTRVSEKCGAVESDCSETGFLARHQPSLLIVEDDEMNRNMLSRRLTRAGYNVLEAHNGEEGLIMARQDLPGLILMDIRLPGMGGIEATRRLKADRRTATIPVIALTAYVMRGDREAMLGAGCDEFDAKPVRMHSLLPKIEALLSRNVSEQ